MFTQSMPWPYKVALLFFFFYKPVRIKSVTLNGDHLLQGVSAYLLLSMLPSLLHSVKNRAETTYVVQMSALTIMQAYVLAQGMRRHRELQMCLDLTLLFVCLHVLVMQRQNMCSKKNAFLLSGLYMHTHMAAVMALLLSASSMAVATEALSLHVWICMLGAVFAGEIMSATSFALHTLLKTIGDVWEHIWL